MGASLAPSKFPCPIQGANFDIFKALNGSGPEYLQDCLHYQPTQVFQLAREGPAKGATGQGSKTGGFQKVDFLSCGPPSLKCLPP